MECSKCGSVYIDYSWFSLSRKEGKGESYFSEAKTQLKLSLKTSCRLRYVQKAANQYEFQFTLPFNFACVFTNF